MSFKKDLKTDFDKMSPEQLQRGIDRWLRGGTDDVSRDQSVRRKVDKTLAKIATKKAAKKQ